MKWKMIKRIIEKESWFFEKKNKVDKPLAKLTKKREKTQINKIKDKRGILQWILLNSKDH
jgi:hypothetical protein